MAFLQTQPIPSYFYSCTDPRRWVDPFSNLQGEERLVMTPFEIIQRGRRDEAYMAWMRKFRLPPRKCVFQVVQCMNFHHSYANPKKDWWDRYRDCLFRVFVMPYTHYESNVKQHYQWYILCPEDSEMLLRYEYDKKGIYIPKRDPISEPWISSDKRIRKLRMLPVEACRHWRHETTGGVLPEGL